MRASRRPSAALARAALASTAPVKDLDHQVFGVDLPESTCTKHRLMPRWTPWGLRASTPSGRGRLLRHPNTDTARLPLPEVDAVIGNPPFVSYQQHIEQTRRRSAAAALEQGVRLSGLASSWAALLVLAASVADIIGDRRKRGRAREFYASP